MRQYAVLKNVVRDVNFGVVVKSDGNLKFFGWSEKAVEWANWANANNANLGQLPPNISVGEFRGMSDEVMKSIILSSEEATAAGSSTIRTKTIAFDAGGERYPNASKFPSFVDSPISGDWIAKNKSINFKAHNFRKEVVQNELALRVRMHELAFNNETKQFVAKPNRITATHTRSEIQKKMSRGAERKFGKKIVEYANKEILKNYVTPTIKRDVMGKSTKDILDVYTKARLGRAIGRAVGGAVRGATPNRRTRGVASRFISGVLDPRKRRDIDGDGMIFDGTWREMPDPNRFIQDPKKPSIDAMRRNRDTIQEAFRRAQGRPSADGEGLRSSGTGLAGLPRGDGRLNLPGGGVGIRSTDPRENAELERSLRGEMDMRRRLSDDMAKIMNELRDAGLTPERPKRGKRERRLSDGDSLRSAGTPSESPRAATAVQMAFDTRNSRKASKMTYDPQANSVEVTYNDGRTRKFDDVPYQEARRAGADDAIDKLITDMETGRIGKESKEPIMGLRSSGMTTRDMMRGQPRPKLARLTPESQRRVDNAQRVLDSGDVDNVRQLTTQIEGLDARISRNQNYLESLRDTLRRLPPNDSRKKDTERDFERAEQELGTDMAIRDLTMQRLRRIDRGPKPGGLRSSGNAAEVADDAGRYDDMPSIENAVAKLTSGDRMSADELDYLDEVTDRILDDPDTPENIRDSMLDLKNVISARKRTGSDSLRSSGGGGRQRGRMPKDFDSISKILQDYLGEDGYGRPWRPGQDTGAKTPVDDIPDLSDEAIRDEIDSIDNAPRIYDGNVTRPRMNRERKAALERELRRRARGGGRRKPTQKPQSQERRPARPGELTPLSTRRSMATTERAAKPRGTTLRSSGGGGGDGETRTPAPKGTARGAGAGPGGKAGHSRMTRTYGKDKKGDDGKVFESLTPEQQDAVKKALAEEVKPALDKKLKTFFSKYWTARTKKGSKKQSVVAVRRRAKGDERGRYEKVAEDTPLDSSDIYEMLYRLDGQVAEGLLEKFEVSDKDTRELKLTDDGEAKISTAKNGYTVQQRALDDAQTILNMAETGDFSALEHLHPSTKKKIADVIKKNGGTVPKGWIDSESSIAGWAGGEGRTKAPDAIDLEKERGIGKKKKEKRLSLFQRLRRVDPERERRVELRAARRQGRIREGIALDPELELKRRVLRGRAMKRTFMSRFRKSRDPEALSTDMKSRKDEVSIVKTNPADGTVEISDNYVDLLHSLDQGLIGINDKKKKGKLSEQQLESEHKTLLRRLWENSGFSETPVQLKQDEVKSLLDAGWQVMIRGTGAEKVNSESYVEQFITAEGRFIPGQGGSAYGIGEYFAFPGEWGGYHGSGGDDRHTIVALIPPTADVMMRRDIEREHSNLGNITSRIGDAFKVFGGRDAVKAMEPDELVAEIDKAVPDLAEDKSRTGQIVKQLRDRMEALSKLPRNDDAQRAAVQEQKEKVLNSLDYLQRFSKQRQAEMIAPLIGVDVIDTNNGDGTGSPMLLHNRTNLAVFQVPTTHQEAIAMTSDSNGARRPKVWTTWKQKSASAPEREAPRRRSPRRARQTQAPAQQPANPNQPTPTPNTPSAQPADGKGAKAPVDVSSWTSSRPQSTGSNPATLLTAPDGTQYYTKLPKGTPDDKDRMETEALASELYKLAGIQSADVQMGTRNGQPVTLSRMVQSRMPNSQADQDEALKGYVVDAWLANWDAPLNDNIKIDSNGNAIRLDVGGSLDFRAQGARKGQAWGNTVGEIDSMKKGGTYDYKKITDAAIKQQAKALGNVTDADIRATVSRIVSDPARAKALADTLIARRDDIVKRYA